MKKTNDDISKEELIKLLQSEDEGIRAYESIQNEKELRASQIELALIKKQREVDERKRIEKAFDEEKNINKIHTCLTEASLKKGEIEKSQIELEAIDNELLILLENSKKRMSKLANQFVDFSREKTFLLTQNQIEARDASADDIKNVSKYYEASIRRNREIINEQVEKEKEAQRNISVLTKTIDIKLLTEEEQKEKERFSSLSINKEIE